MWWSTCLGSLPTQSRMSFAPRFLVMIMLSGNYDCGDTGGSCEWFEPQLWRRPIHLQKGKLIVDAEQCIELPGKMDTMALDLTKRIQRANKNVLKTNFKFLGCPTRTCSAQVVQRRNIIRQFEIWNCECGDADVTTLIKIEKPSDGWLKSPQVWGFRRQWQTSWPANSALQWSSNGISPYCSQDWRKFSNGPTHALHTDWCQGIHEWFYTYKAN